MDWTTALGRAKAILFSPNKEWPVIAERAETVAGLYKDYLLFLVAIPVVASFVRGTIIGVTTPSGAVMRVGVLAGLGGMAVRYVLWLGLIYVLGLIVNALAPKFDGQQSPIQAVKTTAYAFTGAAVGSVGDIIPNVGPWIVLAGLLYTFYLFYLGLPVMMKTPAGKALGYTGLTALASVVVGAAAIVVSGLFVSTYSADQSAFGSGSQGQYQSNAIPKDNELVIQNKGTHTLTEMYSVATASHLLLGDTYWEASVLGDNIAPGARRTLNKGPKGEVTQCKTDMKFVYSDGVVKIIREVDLCNTRNITLDY